MSKNNSKSLIELKHKKLLNNNQGFSLLELVVAVGVVLVFSLVGLLSYNGINRNAKQAAVNNTADTVYNRAMAYETDANPDTNYQTALEEYNETSGSLDNDNTKKVITVEGEKLETNSLRIRAFYTNDESIEAIKTTPNTSTTNNNDAGGNDTVITPPSEAISTETVLKYRCDEDHETTFPNSFTSMGWDSEAVVKLTGTDGTNEEATGAGISHIAIAGVEYTVTINGKFEKLTGNDCLRSIEQIGNDSEVKQITWLGKNIEEVPNQIPDSVTSMYRMFSGPSKYGQKFFGAQKFNQDISNWDVSNVTSMGSMFSGASSFNNGGQPLDWGAKTAKVTSMNSMFFNATAFNQDISGWDVSNVTDMILMFGNASKFNQNISGWNVDKVSQHSYFANGSGIAGTPYIPNFKK